MKTVIYLFLITIISLIPYILVSATLGEWNVMNMSSRQQGIISIGGGVLLFIACCMAVVDIWEKDKWDE